MVEHAGTDDLVEHLPKLLDLLDREPMESEVLQAIFSLKIARVAQAGLADVDCRYTSIGLAQRMDGSLRRSTAGDQDFSICSRLLRRPQQKGQCPTPIGLPIELAVPIEVADRRRIRVALVKGSHCISSPSPRLRGEGWGGMWGGGAGRVGVARGGRGGGLVLGLGGLGRVSGVGEVV